jgi:uncharacterized protein (TIGR00369 family)
MAEMHKQPNSRMCFLCGMQNPVGLKLLFYEDRAAGQVRVAFNVPEEYQGYPGIVHGGIVAAVLDETAGRAVLLEGSDDDLMATLKMTVRFRHPTPTGVRLTAVGWVERPGKNMARVAGEIRLPDGTVTAECTALLGAVPEEFLARWEPEKPYWRVYD